MTLILVMKEVRIGGFAVVWALALLRNVCSFVSVRMVHQLTERHDLRRLFEYLSRAREAEVAQEDAHPDAVVLTRLLRLNATIRGIATGFVMGLVIFVAINWLVLKGGEVVGPHLALLGRFFVGYPVTVAGSFVGFAYGFVSGFAIGHLVCVLYNWIGFKEARVTAR